MLQVKFVYGSDVENLNDELNKALSTIQSENVSIKYDIANLLAFVEHEVEEAYKNRLCCECALWDDGGSSSSLSGFCTMKGQRKRYNCRACSEYKDVRD